MDPRVKVTQGDLVAQIEASQRAAGLSEELAPLLTQGASINKQLKDLEPKLEGKSELKSGVADVQKEMDTLLGPPPPDYGSPVIPVQTDHTSLRYFMTSLRQVQSALQSADAAPTPDQLKALSSLEGPARAALAGWQKIVTLDVPALNRELEQAGLTPINLEK
jgi:hypothetical protein